MNNEQQLWRGIMVLNTLVRNNLLKKLIGNKNEYENY